MCWRAETESARIGAMAMAKRANGEGSVYRRGKGKWYWIGWVDENGERRQRSSGTTDRRVAERLLREETERVHAIREGLIDLRAEAMAEAGRKPIGDILDLFMAKLREAGRSDRHTSAVESHLRRFVKRSEITTLAEITSESVLAEADRMRKAGRSARTRQHVIGNIKALTRWAWREGMSPIDPLAGISLPNPDADRCGMASAGSGRDEWTRTRRNVWAPAGDGLRGGDSDRVAGERTSPPAPVISPP